MDHDFLAVSDLSRVEIEQVLARAQEFSGAFANRALPPALRGKSIALWFSDEGFRNRVAFDLGIRLMGGEPVAIPGACGEREPPEDVGGYLSNWFDAIVVRARRIDDLQLLARGASVPVINARTDHNHPCEILGDLAYVQSVRGNLAGLTVVFVGPASNLCHSWFEAAARLPIRVVQVCPPPLAASRELLDGLRRGAKGELFFEENLQAMLSAADVVYTDSWTDSSRELMLSNLGRYQVTAALLDETPPGSLFLPCPPVHRGEEASADAMQHPKCRVIDAKKYLLHAQNALLVQLLGTSD